MEQSERPAAGGSRSQNVLHIVPQLWESVSPILASALERVPADATEPQLLVVTPDADTALEVARLATYLGGSTRRVVPVTEGGRAGRLVRAGSAVVAGAPAALAQLVSAAHLKLGGIRTVLLVWADEIVEHASAETIDQLFAELPKEASRVAIAGGETEALDSFIERQMFRARRVGDATAANGSPVDIEYLPVSAAGRAQALARVLDELDPPSAAVWARTDDGVREASETLAQLGYDDGAVRVTRDAPGAEVSLAVLYDTPSRREELDAVRASKPQRTVALVRTRELAHLRALLAGGKARPVVLEGPTKRAREREERLRQELRTQLEAGVPPREVLALEPLLADWDGLEVAAAALRLLDRARQAKAATAVPGAFGAQAPTPGGPWKRIFMTVGSMDGATPKDVVGALLNEAKLTKEQVGKVEMRDAHTLVEIALDEADRAAAAINGASIKGRRVVARLDQERSERAPRPERGERPERGDRPPRAGGFAPRGGGFDRGERPARSGPPRGGAGGGGRFERGPRTGGFDRGDRPDRGPRPGGFDRGDRAPRGGGGGFDRGPRGGGGGGFDRGPRGGGAGGFDRGPRPPRAGGGGGFDRGDRPDRGGRAEREPRHPGGERVDWNERAERLRRSKRTRPETPGDRTTGGDEE